MQRPIKPREKYKRTKKFSGGGKTSSSSRLTAAVFVVVVICLLVSPAQAKYGGGTGEPNNPYLISTPNDLNSIGLDPNDWGSHFLLANDINLADYTGTQFNIIGNYSNRFTGVFDGNDHTISNFTYNSTGINYIGLFGYVDDPNAEIKNLGLIDPNVDAGTTGDRVSSLVGVLSDGTIANCYAEGGRVSGDYHVGGLAGMLGSLNNTVIDCYATCSVSGNESIGGLVGLNNGNIYRSYSAGSVAGSTIVGGLVGYNLAGVAGAAKIFDCFSAGDVSGDQGVGGLVGYNVQSAVISRCYSYGRVSGTAYVGGLVGVNNNWAPESFWDIETSDCNSSDGGTGKTTAEMQTRNTFTDAGWDFVNEAANGDEDIWKIYEGKTYPMFAWQNYGGGRGTETNPYLIYTAEDMNAIGIDPNDWDKHFKLMADIDLGAYTGTSFNIIGEWIGEEDSNDYPFTGVFDGNNHTITNFTYTSTGTNGIGLFGYLGSSGELKNLGMENVSVDANNGRCIGGLVGRNEGSISDCHVTGTVDGDWETGGLAGFNYGGMISQCYTIGSVSGANNYTGGLVGEIWGGSILNCYVVASVSGHFWTGGLAGKNNEGTISHCYATGNVSGTDHDTGGLVGMNAFGTISYCYSTGSVSGNNGTGGLVGYSYYGTISHCYATSDVSGNTKTGGLVGENIDTFFMISNCYATGTVSGDDKTGGLMGYNYNGAISNSYATGRVLGTTDVGGLVGYDYSGNYTKSFWDNTLNPDVNGIGNTADPNVIGESTANMQTESTFTSAGWDFVGETDNGIRDIWRLCNEGAEYPQLNWQFLLGDFGCPDGVEMNDLAKLIEQWLLEKLSADIAPDGGDGFVDFSDWAVFADGWQDTTDTNDLAVFVDQWLQRGASFADIAPDEGDGIVNLPDFAALAENWLAGI